jgi:hypothetical protein
MTIGPLGGPVVHHDTLGAREATEFAVAEWMETASISKLCCWSHVSATLGPHTQQKGSARHVSRPTHTAGMPLDHESCQYS